MRHYSAYIYSARLLAARLGRAFRYAMGRTTEADASTMYCEMERITGWYALEMIEVDSFLADVREDYADHPAFPELAARAVARVGQKWESNGDLTSAARDWARDLFKDYAQAGGIELHELSEGTDAKRNFLH